MTYGACESMLYSVAGSSMHPCQGNLVAIRREDLHYARAAQAFCVGIKCRHCMEPFRGCGKRVRFYQVRKQAPQKESPLAFFMCHLFKFIYCLLETAVDHLTICQSMNKENVPPLLWISLSVSMHQ